MNKVEVQEYYNKMLPKFVHIEDKQINTQRPTPVQFKVIAIDGYGKNLKVECDQYSGHIFPVGITRVFPVRRRGSDFSKNDKSELLIFLLIYSF